MFKIVGLSELRELVEPWNRLGLPFFPVARRKQDLWCMKYVGKLEVWDTWQTGSFFASNRLLIKLLFMLSWRKHFSCFSKILIQNVCYRTVLSNKVSYKRLDTKSSLCCSCLFVCSVALRWCCFSELKRWEGLKMLLFLNLGFLWVRIKYTCLLIQGLSGNNGFSPYNFFLEFNFFPCWLQDLSMRPFWYH